MSNRPYKGPTTGQVLESVDNDSSVDLGSFGSWKRGYSPTSFQSDQLHRDDLRQKLVAVQRWLEDLPTSQPAPGVVVPHKPRLTHPQRTVGLLDNFEHKFHQSSQASTAESANITTIDPTITIIQPGVHDREPLHAQPSISRSLPAIAQSSSPFPDQPIITTATTRQTSNSLERSQAEHPFARQLQLVELDNLPNFDWDDNPLASFFPSRPSTQDDVSQASAATQILSSQIPADREQTNDLPDPRPRNRSKQHGAVVKVRRGPQTGGISVSQGPGSQQSSPLIRSGPSRGQRRRRNAIDSDRSSSRRRRPKRRRRSSLKPAASHADRSRPSASPDRGSPTVQQSIPHPSASPRSRGIVSSGIAPRHFIGCENHCPHHLAQPHVYNKKGCSNKKKQSFSQTMTHMVDKHNVKRQSHTVNGEVRKYFWDPDTDVCMCKRCLGDFRTKSEMITHFDEPCPYRAQEKKSDKMCIIYNLFCSTTILPTRPRDSTSPKPAPIHHQSKPSQEPHMASPVERQRPDTRDPFPGRPRVAGPTTKLVPINRDLRDSNPSMPPPQRPSNNPPTRPMAQPNGLNTHFRNMGFIPPKPPTAAESPRTHGHPNQQSQIQASVPPPPIYPPSYSHTPGTIDVGGITYSCMWTVWASDLKMPPGLPLTQAQQPFAPGVSFQHQFPNFPINNGLGETSMFGQPNMHATALSEIPSQATAQPFPRTMGGEEWGSMDDNLFFVGKKETLGDSYVSTQAPPYQPWAPSGSLPQDAPIPNAQQHKVDLDSAYGTQYPS